MREEREDNKSEIVGNYLTAATLKYVKGCESAFYFFLAINRNLCYTDYSIMISLRIFEKINKKIKIFLKIMQPNQNLVVYISVGHLTDRRKDAR
jgi:hypothetical protein